jgi:aminoglycoside phosphotransferase (APT) family kinase protein
VDGFRAPLKIERLGGGQSNPTFQLSADSGDYVLRRKPSGVVLPSAHAVDREFRVLSAFSESGVTVPRIYAICTDNEAIGSIFYVMDLVPGRVFGDPRLPTLTPDGRTTIFFNERDYCQNSFLRFRGT